MNASTISPIYEDRSFAICETSNKVDKINSTFLVKHCCPKPPDPSASYYFRSRVGSFRRCDSCKESPSENFKTIFMLLIADQSLKPKEIFNTYTYIGGIVLSKST